MKAFKILFICCFLTISCSKETPLDLSSLQSTKSYSNITSDFWIYFESFEHEAAIRNINIDISSMEINASLSNDVFLRGEDHIGGVCFHNPDHPRNIIISEKYWKAASGFNKELIIFHELGHCILGKEHTDRIFPDGRCRSLMNSEDSPCITTYNKAFRAYYLNELFLQD